MLVCIFPAAKQMLVNKSHVHLRKP